MHATDRSIVNDLDERITAVDPDWAFLGLEKRTGAHSLIKYPAMMVPAMQSELLTSVRKAVPRTRHVCDPFLGSGTALTEAIASGFDFTGFDLNPLALLISKVKAGPFDVAALAQTADEVAARIARDKSSRYEFNFVGMNKWLLRSNIIGLSKISRAVQPISSAHIRRFFWVALAETIRCTSNSRPSIYKLHLRMAEDIESLQSASIPRFLEVIDRNIECLRQEAARLRAAGRLSRNRYNGKVSLSCVDARELKTHTKLKKEIDLVLTSPPYGDNRTTVPYGQFSYLALSIIPTVDIDPSLADFEVGNTNSLDAASLGGKLKNARRNSEPLRDICPEYGALIDTLLRLDSSQNAAGRWAAYCGDLNTSIAGICSKRRKGGYSIWTIGERNLCRQNVPLVEVLTALHSEAGASLIHVFQRTIPVKRLPRKNDLGDLMSREQICVFRMTQ